ncbi:MAG: hypothetical protein WAT19_09665 [Ferruginibacter sp.]
MIKPFISIILLTMAPALLRAQKTLPEISVAGISGKIIVSWKNEYTIPVANINIQRSFDSLKNYTTIGSVLNPMNAENGYTDNNPPYNKMYYRVFVAFEGGTYLITKPVRPVKEFIAGNENRIRYAWQVDPLVMHTDSTVTTGVYGPDNSDSGITVPPPPPLKLIKTPTEPEIIFPSKRVYTSRMSSVVIQLPDAPSKNYRLRIFDDQEKMVLELTKLKEDFLVLDKMNFMRSGWYRFELYDAEKVVEKNRFFVPKDVKKKTNK